MVVLVDFALRLDVARAPSPLRVRVGKADLSAVALAEVEAALLHQKRRWRDKRSIRKDPISRQRQRVESLSHDQYEADAGIGMSREDHDRMYEEFFMADNVVKEAGTGMGLPLVQSIVMYYEGEIECRSALGKGTAFTVLLPIAKEVV